MMPQRPPIHNSRGKAKRHTADAYRGSPSSRGYDRNHEKRRQMVLGRDPLCVQCLAEGRTRPAVIYDHVVPMSEGGSKDDLANSQGLCVECHNRKSAREKGAR